MLSQKKSKSNLFLVYTALFAVVSFFWLFQFLIFKTSMIWEVDGYLQWYGIFEKFKSVIVSAVSSGSLPLWHWDIGLGSELFSNFSFVIFDPFSYIALLFPTKYLDVAYSIIIVSKLYVSGYVMILVLKKLEKSNYICLIGGISYALCAFGMVSIRHTFFISELIIFPIIVLGIIKVWNKENPIVLIVGVAWQLLVSVYFSYMTAIFAVVYILVKYFVEREKKSVKDFFIVIFKYVGYVLVSLFIAVPVVAVSVYALTNTSTDTAFAIKFFPDIKQIGKFFVSFVSDVNVNNNYGVIGTNGLIVLTIPVMLVIKKKSTYIIMTYVSALCLFLPYLQSVLNGFSYSVGRWCYCMTFFMIVAAMEVMEEIQTNMAKYKKVVMISAGFIVVVGFITKGIFASMSDNSFAIMCINIVGALFCFHVFSGNYSEEKKHKYVLGIVAANISMVLFTMFNPFFGNSISTYNEIGRSYFGYNSSSLKYAEKIEDDDFYRVNTDWNPYPGGSNSPICHSAINTNLFFKVPSTFEYLSTLDSDWIKYNIDTGNAGGNSRRATILSNDNRTRLDYLYGVRYYIGADKNRKEFWDIDYDNYADSYFKKDDAYKYDADIYKSEYDTGLGYVFENVVSNEDYMSEDVEKREQLLMNAAVINDDKIDELGLSKINLSEVDYGDYESIPYELVASDEIIKVKDNGFDVLEDSRGVDVKLSEPIKDADIYVVFKGLKKQPYSLSETAKNRKAAGYMENRLDRYRRMIADLGTAGYGDYQITIRRNTENNLPVKKGILNTDGESQGITGVEDYVVNLGYANGETNNLHIDFDTFGKYTYDYMKVYKVGKDAFAERAKVLSDNVLHTTEVGDDVIKGYVDSQYDGLLYLSILKNDGFEIYIDGEKQKDIYDVNTAFTGVKVSKGHHEVKIVYHIIGYPYVYYISIFGLLLAVVITVLFEMMKRKKNVVKKTVKEVNKEAVKKEEAE